MRQIISRCLIFLFLILTCFLNVTFGIPIIIADNQPSFIVLSATASLSCRVSDQNDYLIHWSFLNHDVVISTNDHVLLDKDKRYSVSKITEGRDIIWTLNITNFRPSDGGFYQCALTDPSGKIEVSKRVFRLSIMGPIMPEKPYKSVNFTDCCVKEDVSKFCFPVCDTGGSESSAAENPQMNCMNDLSKLIKCASDGRNHIACCRRRNVHEDCLNLCREQKPSSMQLAPHSPRYLKCLGQVTNIIRCYQEGQLTIPSPPRAVSTRLIGDGIEVSWSPPLKMWGQEPGERYRVFCCRLDDALGNCLSYTVMSPPKLLSSCITRRGVYYLIYVTAFNIHGTSLPSENITVYIPVIKDSRNIAAENAHLVKCCVNRGIGGLFDDVGNCTSLCQRSASFGTNFPVACYTKLGIISECLSGGVFDHSDCCVRRRVSEDCIQFCRPRHSADAPRFDSYHVKCLQYLPAMVSCFDERANSSLGPPENVVLTNVGMESATLSWSPPKGLSSSSIGGYTVSYSISDDGYTWGKTISATSSPSTTFTTLRGLFPSTHYLATVSAYKDSNMGFPSLTVGFLTLSSDESVSSVQPSQFPNEEYNLTACCLEHNVKTVCMPLCSYDLDFQRVAGSMANIWSCDAETILACGSDGRNHTTCCAMKDVPKLCHVLCAVTHSTSLSLAHRRCVAYQPQISSCLREGLVELPRHPSNFHSSNISAHTATLTWTHPTRGVPVSYYILESRLSGEEWFELRNVTAETVIVQNLPARSIRFFRVISVSFNGTRSLPTNAIGLVTHSKSPPNTNATKTDASLHFKSMEACCEAQNVSESCIRVCRDRGLLEDVLKNPLECKTDWPKILACSHDNRNHTACCARWRGSIFLRIPRHCYGLCDGTGTTRFAECLRYYDTIVSCIQEGWVSIPPPPIDVSVFSSTNTTVLVQWSAVNFTQQVSYIVHWADASVPYSDRTVSTSETNETSFAITGLNVLTKYYIFVTSISGGSESLPSPYIIQKTEFFQYPQVAIFTQPSPYAVEGSRAVFQCDVLAYPPPAVAWYKKLDSNWISASVGNALLLQNVSKDDDGMYRCSAHNKFGSANRSIHLRVQFSPVVTTPSTIEPTFGRALLVCNYTGYPEQTFWYFGGREITETWRYILASRQVGPLIVSELVVKSVQHSDSGDYTCIGRNELGLAKGTVTLKVKVQFVTAAPKVDNVQGCCRRAAAHKPHKCDKACGKNGLVLEALNDDLDACVYGILQMLPCASDGHDHRHCCKSYGVSEPCLPYCAGRAVSKVLKFHQTVDYCFPHAQTIVDCMEEEHSNELPPSPPYGVAAFVKYSSFLYISWRPPYRRFKAVSYYFVGTTDMTTLTQSNTSVGRDPKTGLVPTNCVLHDVRPMRKYIVRVYALRTVTRNGSAPYNVTSESADVSVLTKGVRPDPPLNISWRYTGPSELNVKIAWVHSKRRWLVTKYLLHLVRLHNNGTKKSYSEIEVSSTLDHYKLVDLVPRSKYAVFIQAKNKYFKSEESNQVSFYTQSKPIINHNEGPSLAWASIGIGIAIVLIVLAALVLFALFYYFRNRRFGTLTPGAPKESVAFENPGYSRSDRDGTVEIQGLPSVPGRVEQSDQAHDSRSTSPVMTESHTPVPSIPPPPPASRMKRSMGIDSGLSDKQDFASSAVLDVSGATSTDSDL